jgi:potassium efflux system protein
MPYQQTDQAEGFNNLEKNVADLHAKLATEVDLAAEAKRQLESLVQTAESNLQKHRQFTTAQPKYEAAVKGIPARVKKLNDQIAQLKAKSPEEVKPSMAIETLDKTVDELKQSLTALNVELVQVETEVTRRVSRKQSIRTALQTYDLRMKEAQEDLKALDIAANTLLSKATRAEIETRILMLLAEKPALLSEQSLYEAGEAADLMRLEKDAVAIKVQHAQTRLAELEKLQTAKRQRAAEIAAKTAIDDQRALTKKNPLLSASYEVNTQLAVRLQKLEEKSAETKSKLDSQKKLLEGSEGLRSQYLETRKRVDKIGLSGSVGAMLRKRKSSLPSTQRSLFEADQIKNQINEIQFEMFEVTQRLDDLDADIIRDEIVASAGEQVASVFESLDGPMNELLADRKEKLTAVNKSLDRLFEQLFDLESFDRSMATLTTEYREYINERILWIRSNNVLFSQLDIDKTDRNLAKPSVWSEAFQRCRTVVVESPIYYGIVSLVVILLLLSKPGLRNRVDQLGVVAAKGACDTFWPTVKVLVLTLLIAITVPLIPLAFGLGLAGAANANESNLFDAIGLALLMVAWFAIPVEILRRMCRSGGLANDHFAWTDHAVDLLRRNLQWAAVFGSAIVFAIALLQGLDQTHRIDLIERVLFVVGMAGLGLFLYRCFNPKHGIFNDVLKDNERSWANQTSAIWFGGLLLLPLSLALLAIWGFYYTSLNLAACAYSTFVLAVVIETGRALLMRFILVRRRHVHIEAARRKREAGKQAKIEEKKAAVLARKAERSTADSDLSVASSSTTATESLVDVQPSLDIDENAHEASKLVSLVMVFVWAIGLWMIWTDVLPALRALDNYTVWPRIDAGSFQVADASTVPAATESTGAIGTGESTGAVAMASPATAVTAADGSSSGNAVSVPAHRITVRDLLIFLVISIITVVSARNLPSLLEMLFLEHLPLDRSFRYATKALISYTIVVVGMILAFRALSIGWSNVQWLATALTFGLAFGLQEIFANFVAGIILMFERPIRIGDWITVDEFTGVVTKIRTRATKIVNWDRKEYVIPNKDFITGRLVNWTLSDAINRVVIEVGIAYGSDVDKAKSLIYEICQNHPKTLEEPPTVVAFQEFGDSSLNLSIRTFIGDIESRLPVIDKLHTEINRAFKEAGIEISFPQRDLHVRSIDRGIVDVVRGNSPSV